MKTPLNIRCLLTALVILSCCFANMCQAAGTALAWGATADGRCQVPAGLNDANTVAGGDAHSLALRANGTVLAWGFDGFGQASVPPGLSGISAIAAGAKHSLALRSNGTVVVWGEHPVAPSNLTNVIAISAGWEHSLALRANGTVLSWGSSTNVPPGLTNVISVAAGEDFSLALLADNRVVTWGTNAPVAPAQISNVVAIAAGKAHCLALTRSGTVLAWGANESGQTTVPATLTNAIAIAAGAAHSLALRADGSLLAWGDNLYGQGSVTAAPLGFISIASGYYHNLGIRGDGLPVILGQPLSQSVITTLPAILQVTAAGLQPLTYQWRRGANNIPGATNAVLSFPSVQLSDQGTYSVVVANGLGSVASAPAVLTPVESPPFFALLPVDQTVLCGDNAEFHALASGSQPIHYQWLFQDEPISGATSTNLLLVSVANSNAGLYAVVATNAFGAITSAPVSLTVEPVPPTITSPLAVDAKQGSAFLYQITAQYSPTHFAAAGLPPGLVLDPLTGAISGMPLDSGTFAPLITAFNTCSSDTRTLVITVSSSLPVINSPLLLAGTEGLPVSYQITATESPTGFGATGLPPGLSVDPLTGLISGVPVYAGDFYSTISASNEWGGAYAVLQFALTNATITNLAIANVTYNYSSPYLLDFEFSLLSPPDTNNPNFGNAVVVEPRLLSVVAYEDGRAISPSETAVFISRGSSKLLKTYLVLDFSQSVASLANGDSDDDGISDAVQIMVESAQEFVRQQPADAQIGVYEFHRDDVDPQQVLPLTSDKQLLTDTIAGIWTNYVQGFPAASRCWDALSAAVADLGPTNRDEQHYVIFVSDGVDESSTTTIDEIITAATNNSVKIFCVGFGNELDVTTLQTITSETSGRYYTATDPADLAVQFAQIAKDVKGQYILRWATLKRSSKAFMPSFQVSYQGWTAVSPTNPVTPASTNIDETVDPPVTNITEAVTNYIIGWYTPTDYAGPVTAGALRLAPDAEVLPTAITLRLAYAPRYIRQLRLNYRANWPCTVSLESTNTGELLHNWSLSQTNDDAGGQWVLLTSPNPQSTLTSLPFAGFGNLLTFHFKDIINPSNAFSVFTVDNSLYTNTGGQTFVLENTNAFIAEFPVLPFQTPAPWLIENGFSGDLAAAEISDPDGDGVFTWQEYRAGTDPRNGSSRLAIVNFSKDIYGRNTVSFPTSVYRSYRVMVSSDLAEWEIVRENVVGNGGLMTVVDDNFRLSASALYYIVEVY